MGGESGEPVRLRARYLPPLFGGTYVEHWWEDESMYFLTYRLEHPLLDAPLEEEFRTMRQIEPQRPYRELLAEWITAGLTRTTYPR